MSERTDGAAEPERLKVRITGPADRPVLLYLPGLHGDWTLVGGFKQALGDRARFVELTYPRTLDWTLDDYAAAIETALAEQGIQRGWLLGESFGSQIVWPLLQRQRFGVEGVILAGGFVQHPLLWGVRLAERVAGGVSLKAITYVLFGYAKVARYRYRRSPETVANLREFIARRTELDRQAATHRLRLIARHDPRTIASGATVPVYAMTGVLDPVVPWVFTRPWLRRNCGALRDFRIIWKADHNVLGTAPREAAQLAMQWVRAA